MPSSFDEISSHVEDTNDDIIDIYLKFKDGFADIWSKNPNNTLSFSNIKSKLTQSSVDCFFQRQATDEKSNKQRHKIIVPIGDDMSMEFRVSLMRNHLDNFTDSYCYYVGKCREVPFICEPVEDTKKAKCILHFIEDGKVDGTTSRNFKKLFDEIEDLRIPILDINKEKDREIWKKYVEALRKLVKGKEQIWKIKRIDKPYVEEYRGNERAGFLDVFVSEKDIINQFEKEIEGFFNQEEIEDYGVNENQAFIEFNSFRDLAPYEKDQLDSIANEYFYELPDVAPKHTIAGEISFKYSDDVSKDEIYSKIEDLLNEEYQIDIEIDGDGKLDTEAKNIPHISKLVLGRFAPILDVKIDNSIQLKVSIPSDNNHPIDLKVVKTMLYENGLDRAKYYLSGDNKQLIIEVGAPLKNNFFDNLGLTHVKNVYRFGNGSKPIVEVEGTYIEGNFYCVNNVASKRESDRLLKLIQDSFQDLTFSQKPTKYIFEIIDEGKLERLRQFKDAADEQDKSNFDIKSSVLTIKAEDQVDYDKLLSRIKQEYPLAIIENKPFNPSFFLEFKTNQVLLRKDIVFKIQNELRRSNVGNITYDSIKNYNRNLFEYSYINEEARDSFKELLKKICDQYVNYLTLKFDNDLGTTTYTLVKNESLESEKEKETIKNIHLAEFIFLTPEEKQKLDDAIKKYGDGANFRGGVRIGQLVRKDKDKLKFNISQEFDELINGVSSSRLDLNELAQGFIKPIFPGEITNIERMFRAMKKVTEPDGKNGYPANKNLPNFLFDPKTARIPEENLEEVKIHILSNLNEPLLKGQPKQLDAVSKAIISRDIALIQGPPGTGKTTVIAEIIWQTLLTEPDAKILVTSQTNLAVDNALERLQGKKLVRPIRIGNQNKFEDEGKVYSDKRLIDWKLSKPNSETEKNNADNAISKWIKCIICKCSNAPEFCDIVEKWKRGLLSNDSMIKNKFSDEYLGHVNVFAATCSECGSKKFSSEYQSIFLKNKEIQGDPEFDLVIMDEASKATPPELVLPLTLGKRVVIIGDHKQLPPMIDEKEFSECLETVGAKDLVADWTKPDYKISQFEKLFINAPKEIVASLDTQFRMHEQIMNCISQFYKDQDELENGLICGIKDQMDIPDLSVKASRWHGFLLEPFINPNVHAIWVNVNDAEIKVGTSFENKGEVEAIKTVMRTLTKAKGFEEYYHAFSREEDKEIGVITFYMPQMSKIQEALYPHLKKSDWRTFEQHKYDNEYNIPFRINTVDRFQGMERNIIIVSTVRSNQQINERGKLVKNDRYPFALGFARELPRVNVGFSRAKRLLIVIGNETHFANKPEYAEAIRNMHKIDILQLQNL